MLVILTGPTCGGKSTIERGLREGGFAPVVSTTTRLPRAGEVQGRDYNFLSGTAFLAHEEAGNFIETIRFGENGYGVSKRALHYALTINGQAVVVMEPIGAEAMTRYAESCGIQYRWFFVDAPLEVRTRRLLQRFAADLASAEDDIARHCITAAYANRVKTMLEVESGWSKAASSGQHEYSKIIDSSDGRDALSDILNTIKETAT